MVRCALCVVGGMLFVVCCALCIVRCVLCVFDGLLLDGVVCCLLVADCADLLLFVVCC